MAKGSDYTIAKIEKGPLQRFKNQNQLVKKFGEIGLQVYKAITGKRTTAELRKDLGIEESLFNQIISYMEEAGMAELQMVSVNNTPDSEKAEVQKKTKIDKPKDDSEISKNQDNPNELGPDDEIETEIDFSNEKIENQAKAVKKEESESFETQPKKKKEKEDFGFGDIEPIDFEDIKPIEEDEEFGHLSLKNNVTQEKSDEEFEPIDVEEPEVPSKEKDPGELNNDQEQIEFSEDNGPEDQEENIKIKEESDENLEEELEEEPLDSKPEETEKAEEIPEDIEFSALDQEEEPLSTLSPVEKIISEKYGDIGLRVYALIDGQRTAEEIMQDTGLTETKLVEILDFMDEQGIIKLDYPKKQGSMQSSSFSGQQKTQNTAQPASKESSMGFVPMIENDENLDEARGILSPVEMPIKAPLDIVKSVQMKAKIMLKYGDKGNKLLELINGKNDSIDIALSTNIALFEVIKMLRFLMQNGMIIMKPLSRADVRKKYGDDGYSVYKKYGKEGLMLYELIGKEMTIKQMAEKVTEQKETVVDMFIFIHQVLGIELPIDKDILKQQLGI